LLRKGNLLEAANYCERIGQSWRAASLLGGAIYHKAKLPNEYQSESQGMPTCCRLWLKSCQNLSREAETSVEKAIYGWLCGNMDSILPMCQTSEDRLWAYMHCQALFLRMTALGMEQKNHYVDDNKLPSISEFLYNTRKRTKDSTELSHYNEIKRNLIMGDHDEVLRLVHSIVTPLSSRKTESGEAGAEEKTIIVSGELQEKHPPLPVSSSFLQFTLHLLAYIIPYHLVSTQSSMDEDSDGNNATKRFLLDIVDTYVAACTDSTSTIVYYTLCDREERIARVAKIARSIDLAKRSDFLIWVQELYPSDYKDITMAMVNKILDSDVESSKSATQKDLEKIMSLDLLVESGVCNNYLNRVNALLHSFLEMEKFDAGSNLYDKTKQHILNRVTLSQDVHKENDLQVFHYWGDFITAVRWYDTWRLYRKQCPVVVNNLQPQTENNEEETEVIKLWRKEDSHNANRLRLAFQKVLLNDKWMSFSSDESKEAATKKYFKFKKMLLSRYLEAARHYSREFEVYTKEILNSVLSDDADDMMNIDISDQPNKEQYEAEMEDAESKRFCIDEGDERETLM